MLTYLQINNLAVIENLSIDFHAGFNVLTGETGAGKSVLIKALSLLVGNKANADSIRSGKDQATVLAEYRFAWEHQVVVALEKLGIEMLDAEDHPEFASVQVRRLVSRSGKSRVWINDQLISLQALRSLKELFIDILGQHEGIGLLSAKRHSVYLDMYLDEPSRRKIDEFKCMHQTAHEQLKSILEDLAEFKARALDMDYLQFRMEKIRNLNPSTKDYEELLTTTRDAEKGRALHDAFAILNNLVENESSKLQASVDFLVRIEKIIQQFPVNLSSGEEIGSQSESLRIKLQDFDFELSRWVSNQSQDDLEVDLESLSTRLASYQELMRRMSADTIESLMEKIESIQAQIIFVTEFQSNLEISLKTFESSIRKLDSMAMMLSESRKKFSKSLTQKVLKELKSLAMNQTKFVVDIQERSEGDLSSDPRFSNESVTIESALRQRLIKSAQQLSRFDARGKDVVRFLLSANPGEDPKPLEKVASGGEVSRLLLGLKSVFAHGAESCVLVFDEVDSGVSGKVADLIGQKINSLSKNFQIICISHLAQVAAYATSHYLVSKTQTKNQTETKITSLSGTESDEELARLLSGKEVTKRGLENARELRKTAQSLAQ